MTNFTTLYALEHWTDQTEFERLSLDILNKSGSGIPTPMANRGGGDGGQDIIYTNPAGEKSCVFVSLDKKGLSKFKKDAAKHKKGKYHEYSYFSTAYISYESKKKITSHALEKLGAIVHIYDIEVLRSLLDVRFTDLREKYLGIEIETKSDFEVELNGLTSYSAVVLEKYSQDLFEVTRNKFMFSSRMANTYPISFPHIGIRSTEDILKGIKIYQKEVLEFKAKIDKLYSLNMVYTSNLYDENVNVHVSSEQDLKFEFGNGVLNQPEHPNLSNSSSLMTDMLVSLPSINSQPYVPDKNEFITNIENNGKLITSKLSTINANQKKTLFDEPVFFENLNAYSSIILDIEVFSKYSSNKKHSIEIKISDASLIEFKPQT